MTLLIIILSKKKLLIYKQNTKYKNIIYINIIIKNWYIYIDNVILI